MELYGQLSIFDTEAKGIKSHWRWKGLHHKVCVMCNYLDDGETTPLFCPNCKALMVMPAPTNFLCDSCKWDDKGCCSYDIPLGRTCVNGSAYREKVSA